VKILASKFRGVMESRGVGDSANAAIVRDYGDGWIEVDTRHPSYPRVAREGYTPPHSIRSAAKSMLAELSGFGAMPAMPLCGTELKAILKDWLGIEATPNCSCNAMARKMDDRGPEWARSDEGMSEILGVMRTEHAKRKTILPWSDIAARQLVLLACRRAESGKQ